jgi:hypothetical protein
LFPFPSLHGLLNEKANTPFDFHSVWEWEWEWERGNFDYTVSISWQQLSFGPCRPRNPFILLLIFLKTRIRCLIKFLNWKKKKPMFRMLESFTSGKWELSTFPFSTERERGNYCESFMPLSILDVMPLAKRNK